MGSKPGWGSSCKLGFRLSGDTPGDVDYGDVSSRELRCARFAGLLTQGGTRWSLPPFDWMEAIWNWSGDFRVL